ncbi:HET-domain-containing protein [Hyaloscypha hepaticicola]|uniref:HET-domain-containing protein n=1 Tax=Hyaloscypha hepaticicola TaxID=2082293 RepID=A0A2J6Q1Q9_9HELO|nr:HET-domain-containing protein [Hyaloscypha hepaticicola]
MDDGHMSHISRGAAKYRLHTCQHCQALVLNLRSLLDPSGSTRTASGATLSSYSFTRRHTIQAADQACNFFQFCISNVKVPASKAEPLRTIFPVEDIADELTLEVRFSTKAIEGGIKCYCWVSWDRADKAWMGDRFPDLFWWIFEVSVPKDAAAVCLSTKMIDPCPTSPDNFSMARKWLNNCMESHMKCRAPETSSVPSRLIFVGQGQNPTELRLVPTQKPGQDMSWVALSYCWGGPQPVYTTRENIEDHYAGIDLKILPATVRDAILVTQKLNQQYLWVDCLCIIQDDETDKGRELNKMPDIYHGAILTIVAACASSCRQGFLYDRAAHQPGVVIPTRIYENQGGIAQLTSSGHKNIHEEPVETRGWTYQERILSRRTLSYGTFEMKWTCQEHHFSASDEEQTFLSPPLSSNFPMSGTISEIYDKWAELVESYSSRTLTFPGDKLAALSAIAKYFAQYCRFEPEEYIAGLWEKIMIPCLLWYTQDPDPNTCHDHDYIAPSWSWASLQCEISRHLPPWGLEDEYAQAEVHGAEVILKNPDTPFSAVSRSRLTLKGLVTRAVLDIATNRVREACHAATMSEFPLRAYPDHFNFGKKENQPNEVDIWCLELYRHRHQSVIGGPGGESIPAALNEYRYGLLLRCSNRSLDYYRIGSYMQEISLDPDKSDMPLISDSICDRCINGQFQTREMVMFLI